MAGVIYRVAEWIVRLAYLNLLWIGFSLAGLIVFGFWPATAAMFAIIRRWRMGDSEFPIFKSFWVYFKSDFINVNLLGIILTIFGITLYVNIRFIQVSSFTLFEILNVSLWVLAFFYCLTLLYIIPVYVHYEFNLLQVIKNAFLMMILNPLTTFFMVSGCFVIYIAFVFLPSVIPFFGGSGVALGIMFFATSAFNRIEKKRTRLVGPKSN
ncbi:hypothetical protein LQ50_08490 [Halalkalibacter okhensis]|uniref:Integral membrane protein n=2 Tax=Halalkalibacter okhensis TaxID=333138 RepID=A0A0B0IGW5_9BACI|nr:hypothetical protein LQ50_08490 [Halalkalibacter okhensis]